MRERQVSRAVRRRLIAATLVLTTLTTVGTSPAFCAPQKQIVRTQDDLPRHNYRVPGTAVELLNANEAAFAAWAKQVADDADATLATFEIQDHATLRKLLSRRLNYQLLTHQDAPALETVRQVRALEDKADARLTSGLRTEAILEARIATGESSGASFERVYRERYVAKLQALPWSVTSTRIKEARAGAQMNTGNLIDGIAGQRFDPAVTPQHDVDGETAGELLRFRVMKMVELPLRDPTIAILSQQVAAHTTVKPDIWSQREVTLTDADRTTPVVVAVWDSGVDVSLFPQQTFVDPRPAKALPGNAHGLSFDERSRPTAGWLPLLTPAQRAAFPGFVDDLQGFADLQAAVESPAADTLKAKLAVTPADRQTAYFEQLNLFHDYVHGTHVAGILARGNPAIRLAVAMQITDYHNVPLAPSDALVGALAATYRTYVGWFRTHAVRVVNMSWLVLPSDYEEALSKNGVGKDDAERKALARRYYQIDRDALLAALKGAPEVLFVCAAGNSDSDSAFVEAAPAGFQLPNLITVSAVDQAGDEASFTSYGKTVAVSANGYQVDSVVPGGRHLLLSGTSMATPNVANLAAKLIALDPTLTPSQTIRLIVSGSSRSADGRRHNIDPRASVALLRQARR